MTCANVFHDSFNAMNFLSRLIAALVISIPLAYGAYLMDQEELAMRAALKCEDIVARQMLVTSFWEALLLVGVMILVIFAGIEIISLGIRKAFDAILLRDKSSTLK